MTRFSIDVTTALRLARDGIRVGSAHQLVAPNRLMSDALAELHRAVLAGSLDKGAAQAQLDFLTTTKIRLLGDRVSRAVAWRLAEQFAWTDTAPAEYLGVAKLQSDALVAGDPVLIAHAHGIVPLAPFEALVD